MHYGIQRPAGVLWHGGKMDEQIFLIQILATRPIRYDKLGCKTALCVFRTGVVILPMASWMCALSATVTAKPDSSCSMRSFSLLFCAALAMSRSLILVSSTMLCLWFWRNTSGKQCLWKQQKIRRQHFYFIYRYLFLESNCFLQTGHLLGQTTFSISLIEILWRNGGKKMAQLKPHFKKNYAETCRFLLVGDPTSVMAGKLHHKMFSGRICLYSTFFFFNVSGA